VFISKLIQPNPETLRSLELGQELQVLRSSQQNNPAKYDDHGKVLKEMTLYGTTLGLSCLRLAGLNINPR
jgi:hypothetical protein